MIPKQKGMPLTQLIRMLDFPAIARLEHEFISGHCPSIGQTEPDLWTRIDLHSIEIFGITYDDAASYWPPKLEGLPEDAIEKEKFEKENFQTHFTNSGPERIRILKDLGFDFSDDYGLCLNVTDHFMFQAEAVGRGLIGRMPDISSLKLQNWSAKMENEARIYSQSRKRR